MTEQLVRSLHAALTDSTATTRLSKLANYYDGVQPMAFLPPEVERAIGDRLQSVVINWPRLIIDSIEERLDVEGFRLSANEDANEDLWNLWQASDMDELSQLNHLDAMINGRSFIVVWGDDENPATPRISVEPATAMTVAYRPGTRVLAAALKVWTENGRKQASLFLPDSVERYAGPSTGDAAFQDLGLTSNSWVLVDKFDNPLGRVPVEPFINRPRASSFTGVSELADVIPLADAVNKLATDMMVTSEYHASPRRYATGIEVPRSEDRERLREEVKQYWSEATAGRVWLGPKGVQFGQFPEASLDNFVKAIGMFTAQIAAVSGLPPHYLGVNTDNPASADAIRSAEASLVKRALRKQRGFGASWERVMRMALELRDGELPPRADGMETIWRDPETQTHAQDADAAVKLTGGEPVIDVEQAQEDLGYTPLQRQRMRERRERATATAATAAVQAQIEQARRLQEEDGLTQSAAYAAVGLIAAASQMNDQ